MRQLNIIAYEILNDWKNISFSAKPYAEAMTSLKTLNDYYFDDSATSIVCYFLSNANGWRGETARKVKKELNEMLKEMGI